MATLSGRAQQQLDRLLIHFIAAGRVEAAIRLRETVALALVKADIPSLMTRAYPSVYSKLASLGFRWFKLHRYWFALDTTQAGRTIAVVFYESANIPSRIDEAEDLS